MKAINAQKFEMDIAVWLAQLRMQKGLSQEALAVQMGKGQSDIAKIENGNKKLSLVDVVAWLGILEVPIERLCEVLAPFHKALIDNSRFNSI